MAERKGIPPSIINKDLDCLTYKKTYIDDKREFKFLSNPIVETLADKYTLGYLSNPFTHIDPYDEFIDTEIMDSMIAASDEAQGDCDLEEDDAAEEDDVLELDYVVFSESRSWSNDPSLSQDCPEWLDGKQVEPSKEYWEAGRKLWSGVAK